MRARKPPRNRIRQVVCSHLQDRGLTRTRVLAAAIRKRAIARVVREVAGYLGNTPAVARASYIDPRVIERYEEGHTIASALGELGQDCDFGDLATRDHVEKAVVKLLARRT